MRLSIIQILLFLLTSVSSTFSESIPHADNEPRGRDSLQRIDTRSDYVALDTRQAGYVPIIIGAVELAAFIIGAISGQRKDTKAIVNPSPSNPSQTAQQIMQDTVNNIRTAQSKAGSPISSIAVRFGVPQFPIQWDGVPGQDWGTSVVTVNAAEGQSLWNLYWVTTGSITVNTPNLSNDVAVGGAYISSQDPNNSNLWTIRIVRSP